MQSLSTLLLTGLAVSFCASAIASLLLYQADSFAANRIIFWLMGSLSHADWLAVQRHAMDLRFDWGSAAAAYLRVYQLALADVAQCNAAVRKSAAPALAPF